MITKLNFTDRTIKSYAIRKLTPKECFRLMGVRDNVIGTMQTSLRNNIFEINSRVYSTKGLSPSCLTHTGGNQETKVLVEL